MPRDAVVVRAPETAPRRMASSKRKMYFPTYMPRISGSVVANMPQRNRPKPSCCSPAMNFGPDERPTMAMNTFRPTEFMNQTVGDGMRPNIGRTERSQPKKSPEIKAPPEVERVSGTPPTFATSEPSRAPMAMAAPMNITSATSVCLSGWPSTLVAMLTSWVRPTRVRMSPRLISVSGRIGISVPVAPRVILRRYTPRAQDDVARSARRCPSTFLLNVEALYRNRQQLAVVDFLRRRADQARQHLPAARHRDDVA